MTYVVRRVDHEDRARVAEHLKRLSPDELRCRFLNPVSPEAAARHAWTMDLVQGSAVGAFDVSGAIRGVGELTLVSDDVAELALTVEKTWRGFGLGKVLTRYCLDEASRLGARKMFLTCFAGNTRMRRIARDFDGVVQTCEAGEVETVVPVSPAA